MILIKILVISNNLFVCFVFNNFIVSVLNLKCIFLGFWLNILFNWFEIFFVFI